MHDRPPTPKSKLFGAVTEFLAKTIAHRTTALILAAVVIFGVALLIIANRHNLDSEVLDLLPGQFESVAGLKEYNNEFSQARQLVFVFLADKGHADDLGPFRDHFISELKKQPWIMRTFDQVPIESEEGITEVQGVAPLLLLNLPPEDFRDAVKLLQQAEIRERLTSTLSILIVSGLFFLAFRRFLPLLGIILILGLSALVALALGMLIFRDLNMVAIGFCSILVGLGVDFSLLLFGRYLQARRKGEDHPRAVFVAVRDIGAAVFYVVVTTAIGLLVLGFSRSSGFAQLGGLVALGVAAAGLFMALFLFMFFKPVKPPTKPDFSLIGANRFVDAMFRYW